MSSASAKLGQLLPVSFLYWQVAPVLHKTGPAFHWLDFAAVSAVGSAYGLFFWSAFKQRPLVPVGDPRLDQCLAFHNA